MLKNARFQKSAFSKNWFFGGGPNWRWDPLQQSGLRNYFVMFKVDFHLFRLKGTAPRSGRPIIAFLDQLFSKTTPRAARLKFFGPFFWAECVCCFWGGGAVMSCYVFFHWHWHINTMLHCSIKLGSYKRQAHYCSSSTAMYSLFQNKSPPQQPKHPHPPFQAAEWSNRRVPLPPSSSIGSLLLLQHCHIFFISE